MKKHFFISLVATNFISAEAYASQEAAEEVSYCVVDHIKTENYRANNIASIEAEISRVLASECYLKFETFFSSISAEKKQDYELALSTSDSIAEVKKRSIGAVSAILAVIFYSK